MVEDFDLGISYTPGRANVMAVALSRKSYCNHLEVRKVQPSLVEEFRKLNLHIVPPGALAPPPPGYRKVNLHVVSQGSLNTLVAKADLVDSIKELQNYDSQVEKIKRYLSEGKPSFFTVDDAGTLFFKGRLVVPSKRENLDMTQKVMKESHDTPLSIHPEIGRAHV